MYPGLFPKLLDYGVIDKESYFDIEFYASAVNAYDYLKDCNSQKKSGYFFSILGNKPKVKMLTIDKIYKFAKAKFTIDLLCLPNSIERENSNSIQNHNNYLK